MEKEVYTVDSNVKASVLRGGDPVPQKLLKKPRASAAKCGEAHTPGISQTPGKAIKGKKELCVNC